VARERLRPPAPPPEASQELDEVDAGWDAAPMESRAPRAAAVERAWGDDSEAPTPEVMLAADLPPEPTVDDPEPASAHWLDEEAPEPADEHAAVRNPVGVKFATAGKIYLFDAGDERYRVGERVVVDTERGPRIATVAVTPVRREITRGPLRRVLRRPGKNDQKNLDRNRERDREVLRAARELAREIELPVKVFRAELSLGGGKATVYFSTDDKVDARRLARELGQRAHIRVELRQTGVRDEAKMVGGIGSCGQELCCTTWLPAFVPVSIKNAKDQGLVLNPSKVSGQCGRLKCCLVYEQETYAELRKGLPKLGKRVITDEGEGRVVEVDVLRQRIRVSLVQGDIQVFAAHEVRPMFPSQQPGPRRPDPEPDLDAGDDDDSPPEPRDA
jgi:cell fate regulator YaaT (PSP1 superfamily)